METRFEIRFEASDYDPVWPKKKQKNLHFRLFRMEGEAAKKKRKTRIRIRKSQESNCPAGPNR